MAEQVGGYVAGKGYVSNKKPVEPPVPAQQPSTAGTVVESVRSLLTPFAKSPALAATQAEGLVKKIRP
jgi:hypothetical protein